MEHVGVFRPLLLSHLTGPIPCLRAAENKSLIALLDAEVRLSTAEIWGELQFTRILTAYRDSYSSPLCQARLSSSTGCIM